MAFTWEEPRRTNVVKVAVAYVIVGWFLVQIADTFFPLPQLPECLGVTNIERAGDRGS